MEEWETGEWIENNGEKEGRTTDGGMKRNVREKGGTKEKRKKKKDE